MKTRKILLPAKGYTIREEFFGGLIFDQTFNTIKEINKTGMVVLVELSQGNDFAIELRNKYPSISPKRLEQDATNFVDSLCKKGVITTTGGGRFIKMDWDSGGQCLNAPRSVFWECTPRCNIGTCIHCYAGGNQPSFPNPEGKSFVQQLGNMGVFTIDIGGGEPLLRNDLADLVNLANSYGMRCNIATTLTLKKKQIIRFIEKVDNWKLNVIQISLDGYNAETHDGIRGTQGVFASMIENITILQKQNVDYHFNCTVMSLNHSYLKDIIKTSIKLGARSVRFVRLIPSGRGQDNNLLLTTDNYKIFVLELQRFKEKYKDKIQVKTDDSFMFLEFPKEKLTNLMPRIPWLREPFIGCGAARTLLSVTATNDVLPCTYLRDSKFLAGKVGVSSLSKIWRYSTVLKQFRELTKLDPPCGNCHLKFICLGGCRAAAYGLWGSINAPDPGCWKQ
jgi:radical SAM protein with 4Fe4S-binding SPASM domain